MNTEKNFEVFLRYLKKYITRDGIDNFIEWLKTTDIQTAPASTKYHLSEEGGLILHSVNVMKRLIKLIKLEYGGELENSPYSVDTIAFVSLLHDISRVNFYEKYSKNVRNQETGAWEQVFSYKVKDQKDRLAFGSQEENTIYILNKFFDMSIEEALALRWVEGFSNSNDTQTVAMTFNIYEMSKLALLLHTANMMAICIDESASAELIDIVTANKDEEKEDVVEDEQDSLRPTPETDDCPF